MALYLASGEVEAVKVDQQAHVEELSSLVQQALTETNTGKAQDTLSAQKEIALSQQLHESVQGLLKMNTKSDSARPAQAPPASKSLVRTNAGTHDIEARSQIT
jgi:hypothetical protein